MQPTTRTTIPLQHPLRILTINSPIAELNDDELLQYFKHIFSLNSDMRGEAIGPRHGADLLSMALFPLGIVPRSLSIGAIYS